MQDRFENFTTSVTRLYRCIQRIKNLEMAELGLRGNHTMCLYYLSRHTEGLTASELCELCSEDKAAVSRTLAELSAKGFVESGAPEGRKKYRAKLRLTQEGQGVAARICELVDAAVEKGGAGLSDEQRESFYLSLKIISENLLAYSGEDFNDERK